MTTANFATNGSADLPTLQQIAQQKEQLIGPLTTLSIAGTNTMLTFQFGNSPDANHLVTLAIYADHPAQQPGMTLVCAGTCLVNSASQKVAAYRPVP